MAKLNIAPTKSNYLDLSGQLAVARDGDALLEEKRQILMLELTSRLGEAKRIEKDIAAKSAAAYAAMRRAAMTLGGAALQRLALGMSTQHEIELLGRRVMGVEIPAVEARHPRSEAMPFNYTDRGLIVDEVARRFHELLVVTDKLAEIENAILRLAREVKKTQRRVNALEKIFIPDYSDTVRAIAESLEEKERDEFALMKTIKRRREKERRSP